MQKCKKVEGDMTTNSRFYMRKKKPTQKPVKQEKNPTEDNKLITQLKNWEYEKHSIPKLCNGKLKLQRMNIPHFPNQKSTLYSNAMPH